MGSREKIYHGGTEDTELARKNARCQTSKHVAAWQQKSDRTHHHIRLAKERLDGSLLLLHRLIRCVAQRFFELRFNTEWFGPLAHVSSVKLSLHE